MPSARHHIYLIPGFFGFVNFGRLVYFTHVREYLEEALSRYGIQAELHRCSVSPTSSLRHRCQQLFDYVRETAPAAAGPIHFLGHSTGALDARLLCTPGVDLGDGRDAEPYATRTQSVISICAPHHGTPLASLFTSLLGQKLLQILSLATVFVLREGRLPVSLMVRLGHALARVGLPNSKSEALLDHLQLELVGRLPPDQRDGVTDFFHNVVRDQSLLPQLTTEGIELFNTSTGDRPTVRYGSVVARAEPPSVRGQIKASRRPYRAATYALYLLLSRRAGPAPRTAIDALTPEQRDRLRAALGEIPSPRDTDGIIPTLSQAWGHIIHVARGDHLDVIGHFHDPKHVPPHNDWLETGSDFSRAQFEALWSDVARFIAGADRT